MGRGVAQDNAQAEAWYRKAAEQGDERAEVHVRSMEARCLLAEDNNASPQPSGDSPSHEKRGPPVLPGSPQN